MISSPPGIRGSSSVRILQAGTVAVGTGLITVPFNFPFPHGVASVVVTDGVTGAGYENAGVSNITNNGFNVYVHTSSQTPIKWIAVGN